MDYKAAFAVTPNDSANLPHGECRGIYVGGAGNIVLRTNRDAAAVTLIAVPVGTVLRLSAVQILATSTTATNLVALY
jgi:hypothetical protein